jgi:DNA-binding transcriptional ArsR family regulator
VDIPHPVPVPLAEMIAERFRLLSEPMRIRILDALRDGPMAVGTIATTLDSSQQNVSKHLGLLLRAGIVTRRKEQTASVYDIADPSVFSLCEEVCGGLHRTLEQQVAVIAMPGSAA